MSFRDSILRYRARIDRLFLPRIHPLRYLFLEITRVCNLHCRYCGSDCTPQPQGTELTAAQWIEAISSIARDFPAPKIMVAVTGGEPLLKEGVFDILQALHEHRFRFGMVTNGTRLEPATARKLVSTGIDSISVSLDGPELSHEQQRGHGSFQKALQALRNLKSAGYRGILEVISTLTKETAPVLRETQRLLHEEGIAQWRVVAAFPLGRAMQSSAQMLANSEIKELLDRVATMRKSSKLPVPEYGEEGFLGCRYEQQVRPYFYHCRAGITIGGIKADGSIGACPEIPKNLDQGNVLVDRFSTVWNNGYEAFRNRSWTRKGICADCTDFNVCQGNSLHLWDFARGETRRCYLKEICAG
jgi:radical SAM protein with 4Fe4S-binding SPASM domain